MGSAAITAEGDGRTAHAASGSRSPMGAPEPARGPLAHLDVHGDEETEAIGPRVDGLRLSPGSPTEYRLLEAVCAGPGVCSTGRGLRRSPPACARPAGAAGASAPAASLGSRPARGAGGVVAVVVQLDETDAHAVVVDRDDHPDHPHDPAGPDDRVVVPAPDLVPAFLRRAVLGEADDPALPSASHLRVQGWVATVIHASMAHGSTSSAVAAALDAAPEPTAVRAATLEGVHELVVLGELPGLPAELAGWCGPELTARVVAGVYGRLPAMLRYADEHWPAPGETLGRRTRELLDGTGSSSPGT